jgi:hypothetical protein
VLTKSCNISKRNDLKFTKLLTWKLLVNLKKQIKYVIYNVFDIKVIKNYIKQCVRGSVVENAWNLQSCRHKNRYNCYYIYKNLYLYVIYNGIDINKWKN